MFSVLGVGFMLLPVVGTVGIPGSNLFPPPPAPVNAFPYVFLLYLAAGCGWYFYQQMRSPKLGRRMQQEVEKIHASFDPSNLL